MSKFERDNVYKTRDGREARVICVDGPGASPVVGFIEGNSGPSCWTERGKIFGVGPSYEAAADLMLPKPEPVVEWGMVRGGVFYPTAPATEQTARRICQDLDEPLARRTTEIVE